MNDIPVLPDYEGPCTTNVMRPLVVDPDHLPDFFPTDLHDVDQIVLLVLDGLGWNQMQERLSLLSGLPQMAASRITTVAPTTTATALTSISTGLTPGEHGLIGYRMRMEDQQVLNVLRWSTPRGDARDVYQPETLQTGPAFEGQRPPIVVRAEFRDSGFSRAHLPQCRHIPYRMPSTLVSEVLHQLRTGEPFVYAYYDGIDKVSHEYGLGEVFAAEMIFIDRMVQYLIDHLPRGAALVITADHGQVDVGDNLLVPAPEVMSHVVASSGEGRFRWLHAHPGAEQSLLDAATELHGNVAWVVSAEEMIADEWFGPAVKPAAAARLGDVALVCREPVAFEDPADTGPFVLVGRHGSMTSDEVHVPLLIAKNT